MNPYDELNVPTDATDAEVKAAYKQQAGKHHPDREGGDTEKFKMIAKAYQLLSDPDSRKRYDETGDSGKPQRTPIETRLAELFDSILNSEQFRGDIIKEAQNRVTGSRSQILSMQGKLLQQRKVYEKRLGRVKTKRGVNIYENLIVERLAGIKTNLTKIDDELEMLFQLMTILDEYWDDAPDPMVDQWSELSASTTWSNL